MAETVHACPEGDSGFTPCCDLPPFELRGDRMTLDPALVTCPPRTHPNGVVIPPDKGDPNHGDSLGAWMGQEGAWTGTGDAEVEAKREPRRWSCSGCDNTWGGLVAQHCSARGCHQTFGSTSAGDAHRTKDFRCLAPEAVGLTLDDAGIWRSPATDASRARFARLAAARRAATLAAGAPDSPGPIPESPPAPPEPTDGRTEAPA